jgi:hypothetical protein
MVNLIDAEKLIECVTERMKNKEAYPNGEMPLYTINTIIREQEVVYSIPCDPLKSQKTLADALFGVRQ